MYRSLDIKTEFSMTGYPDKPEKLLEADALLKQRSDQKKALEQFAKS
jgi:hypothetical protein